MTIATLPQAQITITMCTLTNTNHEMTVTESMTLLTQYTYLKPHLQNLKITINTMNQTALVAY